MGSIVLQVNGTTVGQVRKGAGVQITKQVSDIDSARIVAALANFYEPMFSGVGIEPPIEKTIENIIRVWFDDVVRDALKKVERYEASQAKPASITVT